MEKNFPSPFRVATLLKSFGNAQGKKKQPKLVIFEESLFQYQRHTQLVELKVSVFVSVSPFQTNTSSFPATHEFTCYCQLTHSTSNYHHISSFHPETAQLSLTLPSCTSGSNQSQSAIDSLSKYSPNLSTTLHYKCHYQFRNYNFMPGL